jgi:hypothetical protein
MPRIDDFKSFAFIVGAPRCGTTTMSRLLAAHPRVASPFVKEPHFFSQHDLRGLPETELRTHIEQDYLDHFFIDRQPGQDIGADGSVSYLYTPEQLAPILEIWPKARFIVGVRDPLTLLPSLHRRLLFIGDESLRRFEDAWAAVPARARGERIPRRCADPRWLRYDEAGRFGTYVERLFASVGRERCMVVVFDDLVGDPRGQYRRIMEFIGLDPVPNVEVKVVRESKHVRHPWLQRLLKRPPRSLLPYLTNIEYRRRLMKPGTDDLSSNGGATEKLLSLRKRILKWNEADGPKDPVPLQVQQDIRRHLKDEIDHLAQLIGRDLSHWLQPRSGLRA